jgi:hypothetical protein
MKFFKTKAVAALSIALLLSTQTKPMGYDAELALQAPMAQMPVEVVKPTLSQQAVNVFSKTANFTVDSSKSIYGAALDNKALVAGVVGIGAAGLAYKKYPKSAIATGVASSAVTAAALTSKYSPETVERVKNVAGIAGNYAATLAQGAGNYMLEAGKSAANFAVAHTPEFVKEYPLPAALIGGAAVYGTYKAFTPAKNAVKKAANFTAQKAAQAASHINVGKTLAVAPVVGMAGLIAYSNKEAIANMAKEVVSSISNGASAVKNADYAKYGQIAVDAVMPAGQFVANQASKLKVNGARLVNAARNLDVKAMANSTGEYIANHKAVIGGVTAVPVVLGSGYVADKYVLPNLSTLAERKQAKKLAARIANASDVVEVAHPKEVILVDSATVIVDHSPVTQAEVNAITSLLDKQTVKQVAAKAKAKPAPAQQKVASKKQ